MVRRLRPDEEALWRLVAERTTPLHQDRPARKAQAPAPANPRQSPSPGIETFRLGAVAPERPMRHDLAPTPSERLRQSPLRMDRKTHTRISRGRMQPEARIDLHGMTLPEAHPVLTRFILASHAAGRRLVLVITGKGRPGGNFLRDRPGVLRQQVPDWLAAPPLGAVVQQIVPAHRSHGGSGAYYVWLRRRQA